MSEADQNKPADHLVRERIENDLDVTMVVEAAAGTGKTTALIRRILALLRSGRARLSGLVAVTFTDKAAGEMKLRLREAIESARATATGDESDHLTVALRELEAARIQTIHAFCSDLLRERPVEAGVDPLFDVAPEPEARQLFEVAFDQWFLDVLDDPPEGVRRLLRRPARWGYRSRDVLRRAAWALVQRRDHRGPWRRDPYPRAERIDTILVRLGDLGAYASRSKGRRTKLVEHLERLQGWVKEIELREAARDGSRDHDGLEADLRFVGQWWSWKHQGYGRDYGEGISRADVIALRDDVKAELDTVVEACGTDLAPCLHEALWPVVDAYEEAKDRAGKLDFFDLLVRARRLLGENDVARRDLQRRFSHLLVDEFQDTDPMQAELLLLLAADDPDETDPARVRVAPGRLFLVGDPKQSVYRFRRADVTLYESLKERLVSQGAALLPLSVSFRSDPRIQATVNAAFESRMQGDGQATYVALQGWREPDQDRPAVIALPAPRPYSDWGKITFKELGNSFPDAVAGWIHWVVHESGWTVTEPGGNAPVPVEARHVCLLFRRMTAFGRTSVTDGYARALEARGLPHVLVGGRSFHDREEVMAMRSVLTAIEWPDDELSVFAALRGPLFALADDALLAWRHRFRRLHPLRPLEGEEFSDLVAPVARALEILGELHRRRNRRPFADTVTELLEITRAHAGLAFWIGGEQVLGNVLRVAEAARRVEAAGARSFRGFVETLQDDAERGEVAEAPVVEDGTEGVRIMTVHKAKGLEFPIVVLCDPGCGRGSSRPSRAVDPDSRAWFEPLSGCVPIELEERKDEVSRRDREEEDRILYVAATRARDILVVPAIGDGPLDRASAQDERWTDPLETAIYPPASTRHHSQPAIGCPEFGMDSVVGRPPRAEPSRHPVRPGAHATQASTDIVWWDPHRLALDTESTAGLRWQHFLVEDEGGARASESVRAHADWASSRLRTLEDGARPTVTVRTPTDVAAAATDGDVAVERTDVARAGRPAGKRFGNVVHETLAVVPLDANAETVARIAAFHARLAGAPAAERDAAAAAVVSALSHPLLRRAAASPDCRREVPLASREERGWIEGTADLTFREDDGWIVVDFKTSEDDPDHRRVWSTQLACYTRAITRATGLPARAAVLIL